MKYGRLDPDTPIPGTVGEQTVGDFWAWGYSNVLTNNLRGVFAEFLVGTALGAVEDSPRVEWDEFDLLYKGSGIEVKSAAYLQSWDQLGKHSKISWSIAEHFSYDEKSDAWTGKKGRPANVYVLCIYTEDEDRTPAKVLDSSRWLFYVLPTKVIDKELETQKTVSLSVVETLTDPVLYPRLRVRVDEALAHG